MMSRNEHYSILTISQTHLSTLQETD